MMEIINKRKSRRDYLLTEIDIDKVVRLESLIDEYNKKSGLSIEFLEDGSSAFNGIKKSYGMFKNVRSLIVLKGDKDDISLKEKIGYFGELLVLEATRLSLGTCWVGGTFDRDSLEREFENEQVVAVIPIGNVKETSGVKENLIYKLVHRKTKSIEEMYTSDEKVADWFLKGMEAVQKAPSTRNTQKVIFEYKEGIVKASVPETYVFDLVDLGIAKAHFELVAGGTFEIGNNGVFTKED